MTPLDPVLLSFFIFVVAVLGWQQIQVRTLGQRVSALEKQHLALVEELERRLYPSER